MNKIVLIILSNMMLVSIISQTPNSNSNDSINFFQFLEKFKSVELPLDFSLGKTFFKGESISKENLENYICDYGNFCTNTFRLGAQRYFYSIRIPTNKDFYIIVYVSNNIDQFTKHTQFILVTYSKKDYKKMGKLVIWGSKEDRYLIYSKINPDFKIESTSIYTYEKDDNPYKDPNIFRIEEIKAKYIIDEAGNIIKLVESEPIEYPAKFIFDKTKSVHYVYPVEVDKK